MTIQTAMPPFASIADYFETFPSQLPDWASEVAANKALAAACDDIRGYCNQTFNFVAADEITLHGTGRPKLLLPELPIVAVNAVTINKGMATELVVTDFRIDFDDGLLYRPPIQPTVLPEVDWFDSGWDPWLGLLSGWPIGFANITVDYDHGYAVMPENLISVAVQLARNTLSSPPLVFRGEKIGGYSYTRYESYEGPAEFATVLDRFTVNRVPVA